jgi:hypothetical protein
VIVSPWPAVDAFLAFVLRTEPTTPGDWPELVRLLDDLAMARHVCPAPDYPAGGQGDEDDHAAANSDYSGLRPVIGTRFPDFGYYHVVSPLVDGDLDMEQTPGLGDAIDDLADIAVELQQAIWFREHRGHAVGAALLAWAFDVHWGQHLRDLQGYLHCRLRV